MREEALRAIWARCESRGVGCTVLATHHVFFAHQVKRCGYVYRESRHYDAEPVEGRFCRACADGYVTNLRLLNPEYTFHVVWIEGAREALEYLTELAKTG